MELGVSPGSNCVAAMKCADEFMRNMYLKVAKLTWARYNHPTPRKVAGHPLASSSWPSHGFKQLAMSWGKAASHPLASSGWPSLDFKQLAIPWF
ncbi:hypothetical protein J6590_041436 [Homalodisca vitripennis]|nr:hypothetical protein J6590_041436 [Homalodisca vitripennis]